MKLIPDIKVMTVKFTNLPQGNFATITINESTNIVYKINNIDKDVLSDLIESRAYATSLLYLNETSNLYLDEFNTLINESSKVEQFYEDCAELLNKNVEIVEEAGIPLVNIDGYQIYESVDGILRGNGKKKIKECFKEESCSEDCNKEEDLTEDGERNSVFRYSS